MSLLALTRSHLEALLREDVPHGDLTTMSLAIGRVPGEMHFSARDPMVASGVDEASALLELAGAVTEVNARSGQRLPAGAPILSAHGPASALLAGWKTAQTFLEVSSGISTRTAEMVEAAGGVPVACTRKNAPGTKSWVVQAVVAGGAQMHRLGLSESLLVTAEHRCFLGSAQRENLVALLEKSQPEKRVLFEVSSLEEARQLLREGATALQLEKFDPPDLATLVWEAKQSSRPITLVAAGGINLGNVRQYAETGVDVLVTSWPYSAPPRDVQVTFTRKD